MAPLDPQARWPLRAPEGELSWHVSVSDHHADRGFVVRDDSPAAFLRGYRAVGGNSVAGSAISWRFRRGPDAPIEQVFTRLVLQKSRISRAVHPAPLLTMASNGGFDVFLKRFYGIPPVLSPGDAARLRIGVEIQEGFESLGGQKVLGAPTTHPTRRNASVYQRFETAVVEVYRPGSNDQAVRILPVPVHLGAAGFFPAAALRPRDLPIHPVEAGSIVRRGDGMQPYVFITIDDCWSAERTRRCLDIARDERVKITFFPTGAVLREAPDLWRRAVAEGHSIENHSHLHLSFSEMANGRIRWEIEEAGRALNRVLGYEYRQYFLRPPFGAGVLDYQERLIWICQSLGFSLAMWTVDSKGWLYPSDASTRAQEFVLHNLAGSVTPGAILLLHALESDLAALPRLARSIHADGLQSMNLRDQLRIPGVPDPWPCTNPPPVYEEVC